MSRVQIYRIAALGTILGAGAAYPFLPEIGWFAAHIALVLAVMGLWS